MASRRPLRTKLSGLLKRSKSGSDDYLSSSSPKPFISHPYSSPAFESFPAPIFAARVLAASPTSTCKTPSPPSTGSTLITTCTEDSYASQELDIANPLPDIFHKVDIPRARSRTEGDIMNNEVSTARAPAQGARLRQIQDAKKMAQTVSDRAEKRGIQPPDYELHELIGKGTYGRVYKGRNRQDQRICAIKIIEVDHTDYNAEKDARDDTIREFVRETNILRSLKDSNVVNVNEIFDAFPFDSWLWIVTEYCPGGSLATLMKANNRDHYPGLEEDFIIPIAREVAIALESVHKAGIIHRDLKCANILVTEDGRLQLCDFGISNVLENEVSKRSTIIGTPHWMAPELVSHLGTQYPVRYGTEIDCWAYGCALYEMATGLPPHARVRPQDLGHTIHRSPPRLEGTRYPERLKDFVAFLLEESADNRPTAAQIVEHPYINDTRAAYPTESVRKLIQNFAVWESEGGQRTSLFNPFGAGGSGETSDLESMLSLSDASNEWNFSTTLEFERRFSMGLDPFDRQASRKDKNDMTPRERAIEEARVKRGGQAMKGLFDQKESPYGTTDPSQSDLHFRNLSNPPHTAADRTTLIDLDAVIPSFDEGPNLDLDSVPTIKARKFLNNIGEDLQDRPPHGDMSAKRDTIAWTFPDMELNDDAQNEFRKTKDWKFPVMVPDPSKSVIGVDERSQTSRRIPKQNRDTQQWTFPSVWPSAEEFETASRSKNSIVNTKTAPPPPFGYPSSLASSPDRNSLIDLDAALHIEIPEISRPTTADSTAESAATEMTSGDPFDLESEIHLSPPNNRGSLHMKSQSEPSATFQNNQTGGDDTMPLLTPDTNLAHNRSSSVTDGAEMNRNSGRVSTSGYGRWAGRNAYEDSTTWDPFLDNEDDYSSQQPWVGQNHLPTNSQAAYRRRHQRTTTSSGSTRTVTSDEGSSSGNNMGATLRPAHSHRGAGSGSRSTLREPREPNKAALLGSDRRLMEDELAMMYEELASQADTMYILLSGLATEEERKNLGSETTKELSAVVSGAE